MRNHKLSLAIEEAERQSITRLSFRSHGDGDFTRGAGGDVGVKNSMLCARRPFQTQLSEIRELIAVVYRERRGFARFPLGQITLLHVHGRHEHFDVPELRFLATPSVHDAPRSIANDASSGHVV